MGNLSKFEGLVGALSVLGFFLDMGYSIEVIGAVEHDSCRLRRSLERTIEGLVEKSRVTEVPMLQAWCESFDVKCLQKACSQESTVRSCCGKPNGGNLIMISLRNS